MNERKFYKEDKFTTSHNLFNLIRTNIQYERLNTPHMDIYKNLLMQDKINENMNAKNLSRKWWTQDIEILSKYLDIKVMSIFLINFLL